MQYEQYLKSCIDSSVQSHADTQGHYGPLPAAADEAQPCQAQGGAVERNWIEQLPIRAIFNA